ncbi:hypothetical protein ACIA74_38170 [Streptomyces sp. NPDC051658]
MSSESARFGALDRSPTGQPAKVDLRDVFNAICAGLEGGGGTMADSGAA